MKVKTYRGPDTKAAFAQVKAELGEDAVILSTRSFDEAGAKVCEITAAVEPESARAAARNKDDQLGDALGVVQMSRDWERMREHIMALMKPQMDLQGLPPRQRTAMGYLDREGVSEAIMLTVYRRLRQDPGASILPVLDELSLVRPFSGRKWPQKYHVIAGPHGCGKTSTLIKLALLEKSRAPGVRICLVSADQGRGRLVLRHYADLSGLAYREASSAEDFLHLAAEASGFDRIFVDLPGLCQGDRLDALLDRMGLPRSGDMAVHLVLNPYFESRQLRAFAAAYATRAEAGIIWTKLDEACTYGALLNVSHETGLPVSALGIGPGLKNGLVPAEREMIWRLLFMHQLPQAAGAA